MGKVGRETATPKHKTGKRCSMKISTTTIVVIALSETFQAFAYYNTIGMPDLVNPTPYDVHQAEEASWRLGQASVELKDTSAACQAGLLSQQASNDADAMRRRIDEKRRQEEEQKPWINITGNGTLPSVQSVDQFPGNSALPGVQTIDPFPANNAVMTSQNGDPFASNVPFGDSGYTSKPVLTYEQQLLQEYQELQPKPFYDGKDNPGVCMFCHARLLGKQTTCSKCRERKKYAYYNWKTNERKKAARLEQVKEELKARGYTVR